MASEGALTSAGRVAPGPRGRLFSGSIPEMRAGAPQFFLDLVKSYGSVVSFKLGPNNCILVTTPEAARHVLMDNAKNYSKGTRGFKKLQIVMGQGLVTSDGEFWKRQRRMIQPAFHRKQIAKFSVMMHQATEALFEELEEVADQNIAIDVSDLMMRVTMRIVSETLFGEGVEEDVETVGEAVSAVQEEVNRRILSLVDFPLWVPTPANRRLNNAKRALNQVVNRFIEARRREPGDDLLSSLLAMVDDETRDPMLDQQLRDEVMTLYLAGHETTSHALTWTFFLLSRYPGVDEVLGDEARAFFGRGAFSFERLGELRKTEAILRESMRIFPPVWGFSRLAEASDMIDGFNIPKGAMVFVSPWVLHRNPHLYPNPEGFEPERFAGELMQTLPKCAYMPFGAGARQCIGAAFAMMEAKVVLATLAQRYRFFLEMGHRVQGDAVITYRPLHGMKMTVHRRG